MKVVVTLGRKHVTCFWNEYFAATNEKCSLLI